MPKVAPLETGGGGRGRSRRVSSSLNEINVVPLVDVMLVLLIIFMVTAPMMQRGLDVNLPRAQHAQPLQKERVFVTVPLTFRQDHRLQLGKETIRIEVLQERVRQLMEGRSDKEVFLQCDGALTVQDLVSVNDALMAGGVEKVGIVSKLPQER